MVASARVLQFPGGALCYQGPNEWGIKKTTSFQGIYQVACKCPDKKSEQQAKMANIASPVMIQIRIQI
jgi:hypothetical protein